MKNYTYVPTALDLIAEKREKLSEVYRKIYGSKKKKDRDNLYWLPIWIKHYDNAIEKLRIGEDSTGKAENK